MNSDATLNLKTKALIGFLTVCFLTLQLSLCQAGTVAYWTFEGDGTNTVTDGTFMMDTDGRVALTGNGILARDMSGNGNHLFTWDNNATGHQYRTNVPATIVPHTGVANVFSVQNNGGSPATMTWSTNSHPIVDVESIEPLAWTIEASINHTAFTANSTFVGRDGNGETNIASSSRAPLYFQTQNGTVAILFTDAGGRTYDLIDTTGPIALNTWYNVAAVSDGTNLSLYKDSGAGYALVAFTNLLAGDTRLNYDNDGSSTPNDNQWSWTIGRGRFGLSDFQIDNHVDRFAGFIDNVRISDSALSTNDFLGYTTNVYIFRGPTPPVQTVANGAQASFTIIAGGQPPFFYQWRHGGSAILNATNATYTITSAAPADQGFYDVIVTNINAGVTSSVSSLTVHDPRTLTWAGITSAWDTVSSNWTTNNGGSFLEYVETDHVRFDPFGAAQPVVALSGPRQPSSIVVSNGSYAFTSSSVNAGALTLTANAFLSVPGGNVYSTVSIDSGSTLNLIGNHTAGSLSGAGRITGTNGNPTLTFGSNNVSTTWSGTISNAGGNVNIIKVGTGTNTFTGTNYLSGGSSQINGGALILPAGSAILAANAAAADFYVAQGTNSIGYVEINGGTIAISNWLVIGRQALNANGTLVLNSGTISKQGGGNIVVGSLAATGTLIVNSGQVLNNANIWLGEDAGANATLRLNGGTIQATLIRINGATVSSSTAFFNGGTLQAMASSANFIQSPVVTMISAGGLNFDNNGFNTTVNTFLLEDTGSPGGGVTKFGAGTLTLAGGYNYSGPTIVRGGTLSLNPGSGLLVSSPNLVVSNASLTVAAGSAALTAGTLTLGNSAVVNVDFGTVFVNPTVAAIAASGAFTASGSTITINITGAGLQIGTIPLITYGGSTLANIANFVLGPLPPGVTANLANNANSLDLVISATGQNLTWYGDVSNVWDINGVANWANSTVPGAKYLEYGATGDPVRFDGTAIGNFDINLTASVHPFSVTVDALNNYSFTGTGGITGPTSLVKSNSGILTVGTANSFTGGTFIYGGTLVISNNAALGNSSGGVTLAFGNLQLENSPNLGARPVSVTAASTVAVPSGTTATIGGTISGAAALRKNDLGTLNITGSNTFTGALDANQGTINFSGTNNAGGALLNGAFMGVGSTLGSATINLPPGANLNRFEVKLGNQTGAKGTFNMTNATLLTGGGEIWVGGSADNLTVEGEFNLVGGSVTVSNWTAIGRSFGAGLPPSKGVLNIIGGAWTNRGANNFVVCSAPNNIGIVNVSAGGIIVAGIGTGQNNQIWVGEQGNGIMNINNASVYATRAANPAFVVGRGAGAAVNAAGSVRLVSGILDSADQTYLGHGAGGSGSYAELNQMGGKFVSRWYFVVGFNNDRAIYRQSGGDAYITNVFMTVGAGGTASVGVADLSGGTFTTFGLGQGGNGDSGIFIAERGVGIVNIRNNAQVNLSGTAGNGGIRFAAQAGASGVLNLNGGLLATPRIGKVNAASAATVNFNGGLLRATLPNAAFMTGLNAAYVRAGGANIDDGGNAITIGQALQAPPDNGVTLIPVADGGSNYIGAPLVVISGGTGTNCTAVANMVSDGSPNGTFKVGSITITSPGNYTVDPTTVSFLGGGQNSVAATAGAVTTAANTSGALTKLGSGTVILNGAANTYTGLTTVSNGALYVNGSLPGSVIARPGTTFGGGGTIGGLVTVEANGTFTAGSSIGLMTLSSSPVLASTVTIVAELNRTNAQTSDRIVVVGNPITYPSTLVLTNIGTPLQVGDTFTLFNASSYIGNFTTIVSRTLGQVVTWDTSQLAVNGTVSVTTVARINMNATLVGNSLNLAWPPDQRGMKLQTNAVGLGNPAAWFTYPGSTAVTNVSLTLDPSKTNVFFRLVYP